MVFEALSATVSYRTIRVVATRASAVATAPSRRPTPRTHAFASITPRVRNVNEVSGARLESDSMHFVLLPCSESMRFVSVLERSRLPESVERNANVVHLPLYRNIHWQPMRDVDAQSVWWIVHERVRVSPRVDRSERRFRRFSRSPCVNGACVCPSQYMGTFCGYRKSPPSSLPTDPRDCVA